METLIKDIRYGARMLVKKPGFSLIAVITLALGIGANTAIFSVVNAVLLTPLPYPESDRLVWISERGNNFDSMSISYPDFADWRAQQTVFEYIGVYNQLSINLTGTGEPQRLLCERISADALNALRVKPLHGRTFSADEDKPGAPKVILLSYALWQTRLGGDPAIVNQTLTLDGEEYAVVGIMPSDFAFPGRVDIWTPAGPWSSSSNWQERDNHPGLLGVARLNPGVTIDQARAEMDTIAERLEQQYPNTNKDVRARIDPLLDNYVQDVSVALWMMLSAVALVLLIACANVANLLLARAAARQKEMAVRAALGASRWRVVRQLLTESSLLAAGGATLGVLLAMWGVPLLLSVSKDAIPRATEVKLDLRVLAFTAGLALLTGILFGLAPAWQASRPEVQSVLKETARGTTGRRAALRHGLVVGQIAITLVLLVGAGLLMRSFYRLRQVDGGFNHERVLSFRLDLPEQKYPKPDQQAAFFRSLYQRLTAVPGVEHVGFSSQVPLAKYGWQTTYQIEGEPVLAPHERPSMEVTVASADYFPALGIPLKRGRYFTGQDNLDHLKTRDLGDFNELEKMVSGLNTIIVDEEFVKRHWPNEDPIGKQVRMPWGRDAARQPLLTVVGVVARVKLDRLNEQGGFVQAYFPFSQIGPSGGVVTIRTTLEPEAFAAIARQQVLVVDPDQPIFDLHTLAELRDTSMASERLYLTLLSVFAGVALLLAAIGLYGVISYGIAQRTHELGLRMALGAQTHDVLALVMGQGVKLAVVGVAIGLAGAWGLTRLMSTLLFGVSATDPVTFCLIALVLALVTLAACFVPARRATRVDPMVALRYE